MKGSSAVLLVVFLSVNVLGVFLSPHSCLIIVVPVLVLLFVALWFILRGDLFCVCLALYNFVLVFFSSFSIAITSLGEERASLGAFCSICACLVLSVSSSSGCLGRAAVCDCGTPWTFLLTSFFNRILHVFL